MDIKKVKTIFTVIASVIVIVSIFVGAQLAGQKQQPKIDAAAAGKMFIDPSTQTLHPGDSFNFTVKIDTSGEKLVGTDVVIKYNPSIIEVNSLTKGAGVSNYESVIRSKIDNTEGSFTYTIFTTDTNIATTGTLEVVKVTAKVKSPVTLGTYPLTVDSKSAAAALDFSEDLLTQRINGSVVVESETGGSGVVGEPNSCGGTCGSNYNCKSGYFCYEGYCRKPECPTSANCNCSATAKPTVKPTVKAGVKTATPTLRAKTPTATPYEYIMNDVTPTPFEYNPDDYAPEPLGTVEEPENKVAGYVKAGVYGLGGLFVVLLIVAIVNAIKDRNKPKIINPSE